MEPNFEIYEDPPGMRVVPIFKLDPCKQCGNTERPICMHCGRCDLCCDPNDSCPPGAVG